MKTTNASNIVWLGSDLTANLFRSIPFQHDPDEVLHSVEYYIDLIRGRSDRMLRSTRLIYCIATLRDACEVVYRSSVDQEIRDTLDRMIGDMVDLIQPSVVEWSTRNPDVWIGVSISE